MTEFTLAVGDAWLNYLAKLKGFDLAFTGTTDGLVVRTKISALKVQVKVTLTATATVGKADGLSVSVSSATAAGFLPVKWLAVKKILSNLQGMPKLNAAMQDDGSIGIDLHGFNPASIQFLDGAISITLVLP